MSFQLFLFATVAAVWWTIADGAYLDARNDNAIENVKHLDAIDETASSLDVFGKDDARPADTLPLLANATGLACLLSDPYSCPSGEVCIGASHNDSASLMLSSAVEGNNNASVGMGMGVCGHCSLDSQCEALNSQWQCRLDQGALCAHKVLGPVSGADIGAFVLIFLGGALAAGGGLGGGGLFVPLLVMVAGFSTKEAIPLSNAAIAGVAVCNVVILWRRRHPLFDRPLIDFRMAAVMQPPMLLGTLLGVLLNTVLPGWLILILLVVILMTTGVRTYMRAWRQHKLEKARDQKLKEDGGADPAVAHTATKLAAAGAGSKNDGKNDDDDDDDDDDDTMIDGMLNSAKPLAKGHPCRGPGCPEENRGRGATGRRRSRRSFPNADGSGSKGGALSSPGHRRRGRSRGGRRSGASGSKSRSRQRAQETVGKAVPAASASAEPSTNDLIESIKTHESGVPWLLLIAQVGVLVLLTVSSVLKGSSKGPSVIGIQPCSAWFWVLLWSPGPFILVMIGLVARHLAGRDTEKRRLGMYEDAPDDSGDVQWRLRVVLSLAGASALAGAMASLLGIGGGMVLGPVMLEMGVRPDVASATSSLMVLFTALASISQFLVLKRLPFDYGGAFFAVGLLSSVVGLTFVLRLVKKSGKTSIVAWIIGTVLVGATILLGVIGTINVVNDVQNNNQEALGFASVC